MKLQVCELSCVLGICWTAACRLCQVQLWTSTSEKVHDWSARCSAMHVITSRVSSSWMKLMPSVCCWAGAVQIWLNI